MDFLDWTHDFQNLFTAQYFDRPLLLILDEFDSLEPDTIQQLVGEFRNMYIARLRNPGGNLLTDSPYLLHGVCLIGVRAVLGVENAKGSPFNVQRSMHIPNLTEAEVDEMFRWYERDSGQKVEQAVVDRLYYETRGQPGLTSWFGELLTETCNERKGEPISIRNWDYVYALATQALPDNNILNIISKVKESDHLPAVVDLFRTEEKTPFSFDNPAMNYLYMNGVIDFETDEGENKRYARFSCPYVQRRLFNRFSDDVFHEVNPIVDHFDELEDAVRPDGLVVRNILKRYQVWLDREIKRENFLEGAPRRVDMRVREAVWHFSLYRYLASRFANYPMRIHPEFPTGNGKIDLIIEYKGETYALELKSFQDMTQFKKAVDQAARYARSLGLSRVLLAFFIDAIDDKNRARLEVDVEHADAGVTVEVCFLLTRGE